MHKIALSFAGEQRDFVREVARHLSLMTDVFFDEFYEEEFMKNHMTEYLQGKYEDGAEYVVMFISSAYLNKVWTNHERRAALSGMVCSSPERILLYKFDEVDVPGIANDRYYKTIAQLAPAQVAAHICSVAGISLENVKMDRVPYPSSQKLRGVVEFNHDNHNGRHEFGDEQTKFTAAFSTAGPNSVHCYNDPADISGVAIADGISDMKDIGDTTQYDFTSRSRRAEEGEIVIWKNKYGFTMATQIYEVNYKGREGANEHKISLGYIIDPSGSSTFSIA